MPTAVIQALVDPCLGGNGCKLEHRGQRGSGGPCGVGPLHRLNSPPKVLVADAIRPHLALIGRMLIITGEVAFAIDVDGGALLLTPARSLIGCR